MPTTFDECDPSVYRLLDALIAEHRSDLAVAQPRFKLNFAYAEGKGPALKHRGQKVLGRCKVHNLTDRARGTADVTIELDGDWWATAPELRRRALLHHELAHCGCTPGKLDLDDRPKLHSVHGDWDGDGFVALVHLYGEDSVERRWLKGIEGMLIQGELPLGDPVEEDESEVQEQDDEDEDPQDEVEEFEDEESEEDEDSPTVAMRGVI